jgi:hypothetical protein
MYGEFGEFQAKTEASGRTARDLVFHPLFTNLRAPVDQFASDIEPGKRPTSPILFYAAAALVLAAGIWHSAGLATVNDDAFISFRYAQQLVNGNGLVYNPGERVEGYTNFLWTVLIAGGMSLGADPVVLSIVLGIGFFAGTILVVFLLSRRLNAGGGGILPVLPLAALALVVHRDVNVYATSGLETSMEAFLVTALFATIVLRDDALGYMSAGIILTAALMTRPDAAVYGLAVAAFIILEKKEMFRRLLWFGFPLIALFLPYWIIRWQYYGFFFPNAFYAKSIDLPYYAQGLTYAWMYFSAYYPLLIIPVVVGVGFVFGDRERPAHAAAMPAETHHHDPQTPEQVPGRDLGSRALRLGILLAGFFTLFIVRIGGDFMFARFFIPVTPVIYLLLELLVRRTSPSLLGYALALLLVAGTFYRCDHFSAGSQVGYIADEWQRYPLASLDETMKNGALLKKYFNGLPVQVAFWGGQARLMYYAEPYQAIETMAGLTDTFIAHIRLEERGRPGHEKRAPTNYLVHRGVDFYFRPFKATASALPPLNLIVFDSLGAMITAYRNAVMDSLRKYPGVRFQPMPEYLDQYIAAMEEKNPAGIADDYAWFREYYFRHNDDRPREAAFRYFLARAGLPLPGG